MINEFKKGFQEFSLNFNALINLILLSLVYFLAVGSSAVTAKLFRKHFLNLKVSSRRKSYWVKPEAGPTTISGALKQF